MGTETGTRSRAVPLFPIGNSRHNIARVDCDSVPVLFAKNTMCERVVIAVIKLMPRLAEFDHRT